MLVPASEHPIGVVTGLTGERRVVEGVPGLLARCDGPGPEKAEAAARGLLEAGVRALVSVGICGALDPALRPGDVILPTRVVNRHDDAESWLVDAVWHAAVMATAPPDATFNTGALLGSDTPVVSVGGKHHLAARTGAVAVDMESHAVARVAAEANVPFLVVRTVADTAADALPRWLAGVLNRDGAPNAGAAARRILLGPWRLPVLIRLAKRNAAAERALSEAGAALARATRG